jgi:outer membrane protein
MAFHHQPDVLTVEVLVSDGSASKVKKMLLGAATAAVFSGMLMAQATQKIATIHIQNAMVGTKEGQKAAAGLQARVEPRRKEIEAKQASIAAKQAELNKSRNTMAEAKLANLQRDIDVLTKSLQRDSQDAQEELQQEQDKVLNELGQKMMVVIDKFARDNGYSLVIDISTQQSPVLWASNNVDITKDIVDLYDKNTPGMGAPASSAAAPPAAPSVAAPKKAAPPK